MPTHAKLASQLLRDAAAFFRNLAQENEAVRDDMNENATVFEQMATLLEGDPGGSVNDQTYGNLAGQLLKDAATFFKTLAAENPPLEEQMTENASVFEHISALVTQDPLGVMD